MRYNFLNDNLKKIFHHYKEIPVIEKLVEQEFGIKPEITIISQNHTYLIDIGGRLMKARFVTVCNNIHETLLAAGCAVPKIIKRIHYDANLDLKFVEWLEGIIYKNQFSKTTVYETIPHEHYYHAGKVLAEISNIDLPEDGRRIGMSDVYWPNFIVSNEKVFLIDVSKLFLTDFPEHFIFYQLLFHEYTPKEHKEAFVSGYLQFHKKRNRENGTLTVMKRMIEGIL